MLSLKNIRKNCKLHFQLTWYSINGPQRPQNSDCPYGGQIQVLHMHNIFQEPSQDNEKIQTIPGVSQIGGLAIDSHGDHFNAHFQGEEGEDDIIECLEEIFIKN